MLLGLYIGFVLGFIVTGVGLTFFFRHRMEMEEEKRKNRDIAHSEKSSLRTNPELRCIADWIISELIRLADDRLRPDTRSLVFEYDDFEVVRALKSVTTVMDSDAYDNFGMFINAHLRRAGWEFWDDRDRIHLTRIFNASRLASALNSYHVSFSSLFLDSVSLPLGVLAFISNGGAYDVVFRPSRYLLPENISDIKLSIGELELVTGTSFSYIFPTDTTREVLFSLADSGVELVFSASE